MERKAVVFGGAGFIGSHLVRELCSGNQYSRIVVADIAEVPRMRLPGAEYIHCDVREPISDDLCPGVTEIYNLAAIHKTPGSEEWEYYWTNILGATNVAQFAAKSHTNFIAFTSSISVYGASEKPKDEAVTPSPDSAYGRSKYAAEKIHMQWHAEKPAERRLVIVRPAVIYGLGEQGNFTRLARVLRRHLFFFPGRSDTIKSCGYVEDLVAAILWARDRAEAALLFNFCHPERYTSKIICDTFEKVGHYRAVRAVIPLRLLLGACMLCKVFESMGLRLPLNKARVMKLNRSTNILPKRLIELGFQFRFNLESGLVRWRASSNAADFE
jgi:nucleoside-diphosphate-sugar epimerase